MTATPQPETTPYESLLADLRQATDRELESMLDRQDLPAVLVTVHKVRPEQDSHKHAALVATHSNGTTHA